MDMQNALENMVRTGTVTDVDSSTNRARVLYEDMDEMTSGWVYILQHLDTDVLVAPDGAHTHTLTTGSASTAPDHAHKGSALGKWLPQVNDRVLIIYVPVPNADGFILGGY